MSVQSIYTSVATTKNADVNTISKATEKTAEEVNSTATENKTGFSETAVVYEKTPKEENSVTAKSIKNSGFDRETIIAQMKADVENRMGQLTGIVQKMMTQQGQTIANADDMWKFLAKGDYTVDPDVKAQAQADIAEDGYWGVEKTSERILDFAKALSGGDADKADELFSAFKQGFEEATGSWGKELPEISQKTYEAVEEKFEAWKAETQASTTEAEAVAAQATQF